MIDKMIDRNINFLQKYGVEMNNDDDKAVYKYGLQILYYYLVDLVVIFSLAAIFGRLYETMIMTFIFGLFQVFGGGYHTKTPLKCLLTMLVGAAVGNVLITLMAGQIGFTIVAGGIFAGIIAAVPPVTNKRHPIGKKVQRRSKTVVRCTVILILIGIIVGGYLDRYVEIATVMVTMGLYLISFNTAKRKNK